MATEAANEAAGGSLFCTTAIAGTAKQFQLSAFRDFDPIPGIRNYCHGAKQSNLTFYGSGNREGGMLSGFLTGATHIYVATGGTDFRKQSESLCALVSGKFQLDPYTPTCVFLFCNKRRNAIKALRFESDGFVLASKKLMNGMKYQWPRTSDEVRAITAKQAQWLYDGLELEPKKAHKPVPLSAKNTCY